MGALLSAFVAPLAIFMGKFLGVREEYERLRKRDTRIIEADDIHEAPAVETPAPGAEEERHAEDDQPAQEMPQ